MSELSTKSASLAAEANDMEFLLTTGQAKKSARGMPWHQEPTKDVTSCDKLRGAANKRYIRRFPNGETLMMKNHEA